MVDISGAYGKLKTWVKAQLHTDHQIASAESAKFKDVNIELNEAYKQGTSIILRIKALNTFVGLDAGRYNSTGYQNNFMGAYAGYFNSTGYYNNFMGYSAGYSNTTGYRNNFMGFSAGYSNTTGNYNNFMGAASGYANISGNFNNFIGTVAGRFNTIGYHNNFMGYSTGYANISGYYNNFLGAASGYSNTTGYQNNFLGAYAGHSNISGNRNNFMGFSAGYHETGSYKLFIDNAARADEADGRIKALIYGVFNAATANQLVRLNAILELTEIKNGSTQANAGAAANEVWKTNGHASLPDNVLMIGV